MTVVIVAAIGVIINTLTALLFVQGQKHDLNIRGAFLHMSADAGVSLGVVVAGTLIMIKGWLWIDPVVSLAVVAIVFIGTWGLLRDSFNYAIDAVPKSIDIVGIKQYMTDFDHVHRIHDLHVWPLSTNEVALTVHIVVKNDSLDNRFLRELQQHLHDHFGIDHATVQLETSMNESECMLDKYKCE
jgi:cobalt-zinc-cadmium efflux system protein